MVRLRRNATPFLPPMLAILLAGCAQRAAPFGTGSPVVLDEAEKRLWHTAQAHSATILASGVRYRDAELEAYLNSVLHRLLGEDRGAYDPVSPRVYVVDSPSLNASAFPHGDIFIHTGMLGRLRNEAQLAMLLGHELTHATHRHMHQHRKHAYTSRGAAAYVSVLSAAGGGNVQSVVSTMGQLMTQASISGYGRDKEREADRIGLLLMAEAGYDPAEGGRMFEQMLAASDSSDRRWNFFYATHPKMKDRVRSCDELLGSLPQELRETARTRETERYLDAARPLIYDEVARHIARGRFELAAETLDFLHEARPSDATALAYRGDLFRARGAPDDLDQGRRAYEKALETNPREPIALRGLGLLHFAQGDSPAAMRYLERYLAVAGDVSDRPLILQTVERLKGD